MALHRLNQLLEAANHPALPPELIQKFAASLALLQKWNAKTNLTAIRDEEGILSRHFLESILCARALPEGIQTLLDFGSGAGFLGLRYLKSCESRVIGAVCKSLEDRIVLNTNVKTGPARYVERLHALLPRDNGSGPAEICGPSWECLRLR